MTKKIDLGKILLVAVAAILLLLPTYLVRFKLFGIPTTFLEIYIYLVFIIFIATEYRTIGKTKSKNFIWVGLLILIALFSSFFARERMIALGQWKAYFFDGFLVLAMFYHQKDKLLFKMASLNFLIGSAVIVSIWGLLQKFGIVGLLSHQQIDPTVASELAQGRILGPFESPNYLAMYLLPVITLLIINYFRVGEFVKLRKYFWPLVLLFLITLALTESASAILALVAVLALYYLWQGKNRLKWLYLAAVIAAIIFGTYYLVHHTSKSGSVAARAEIYKAAVQIGNKHPLTGIGMANFPRYFLELDIPGRLNYEAMHPHNIFLAFWVYMGYPGLIAFLALLVVLLNKKNLGRQPLYYFAILAIIVNGLTDTTFFKNDLAIVFWAMAAMLI